MAKKVIEKAKKYYSDEEKIRIANEICEDICNKGLSTREAVKAKGEFVLSTFYVILDDFKEVSDNYARAKDSAIEYWEDKMIEVAETALMMDEEKNGVNNILGAWTETKSYDNVQRSRLIIDAIDKKRARMERKNFKEDKGQRDLSTITIEVVNPTIDIDEL